MTGKCSRHNAIADFLSGFSIEVTAKDADAVTQCDNGLPPPSAVFLPWLANETVESRVAAAVHLRQAGYEPVVHVAARHLRDRTELESFLTILSTRADVHRLLLVGGDLPSPTGPFGTVLSIIESGLLERANIRSVGIAGHPEGHSAVDPAVLWQALHDKCEALAHRGIAAEIVTQFSFDAKSVLSWLSELRARAIMPPVAIGLPGPAGIKTLLRYASRCGVGASAAVVAKYGVSLTRLIGKAGPEPFLADLTDGLSEGTMGTVRAHVYPFGGFKDTARWLEDALPSNSNYPKAPT
jgi:methylenetetrahydrofolate reductase (NADPH)